MLIPQHTMRTSHESFCFILVLTDSPLHKIHVKYHEWDRKCNVWEEVTGIFPKEGLTGLVWSRTVALP